MTSPEPTRAPTDAEIRRRQRSRAIVMAFALLALVVLFYAVSIVKIANAQ